MAFLFNPKYIWLATGSSSNFSEKFLYPIKDKQIIVFPDTDSYDKWLKKTQELNKNGYKITVSDMLQNYNIDRGSDLADIILYLTKGGED